MGAPLLDRSWRYQPNLQYVSLLRGSEEEFDQRIHTWNWELSLSLQESRVCFDELLRLRTHRISIIPSAEVYSTPSRLLNCSSRDRGRWFRNDHRMAIFFLPPSSAASTYTHINIANRDSSSHYCGLFGGVRGIVVGSWLEKVRGRSRGFGCKFAVVRSLRKLS